MPKGDPPTTPYIYNEIGIHVEVNFDNTTFALTDPAISGTRDEGCSWSQIQIGEDLFPMPADPGPFEITQAELNGRGYDTIQNVTDAGFTLAQ